MRFSRRAFRRRPVLYAACDGSTHPHLGGGAWAWVTSEGRWTSKAADSPIGVLELAAAVSLGAHLAKQERRGVMFTDSQLVLAVLHGQEYPPAGFRAFPDLAATRELMGEGLLRVAWVPSHDGHPLNEVADRLALLRHRGVWWGMTVEEIRAAGDRCVAEYLPELGAHEWEAAYEQAAPNVADALRHRARALRRQARLRNAAARTRRR